jgi:hypothetical protein
MASNRFSFGTAHLNGGLELTRTHHAGAFGGLILEGPFGWLVRPVAEGFVERDFGVDTTYSVLLGAIGRAADNLSFDGAVRWGRSGDATLTEVRAGLTWSFEL